MECARFKDHLFVDQGELYEWCTTESVNRGFYAQIFGLKRST